MGYALDGTQKAAVQRLIEEPTKAALIASTTGAGKTAIALTFASQKDINTILVIAPGDTFRNPLDGWQSEVETNLPHLKDKQYIIESKHLDYVEDLKNGVPGVYYITHTYFTLCGSRKIVQDPTTNKVTVSRKQVVFWDTIVPDLVILDECHQLSNRKGVGANVLKDLKPRYKIAMSATPGGDHFEGLWAPTRWLWPEHIDRSFWRWASRWGTTEKARHKNAKAQSMVVTGEKDPGAFTGSLPCYIRDQPPNIKVPVSPWYEVAMEMTPAQKKQYDSMLKTSIAWLEENPLVAEVPIAQKVRLRQMCLGEVHFNQNGEVDFPDNTKSAKLDAAVKIATDRHPNEKIVMYVGDSQKFAEVAAQRLRDHGVQAEAWHGKVSKANRRKLKDRFVRGTNEDLRVLVASVTSISDGVDGLQLVCNTEVWFNKSLYGIKNEQAEGRLNRRGQTQPAITRYELVIPDTADEETFALDARKFITRMKELN